MHLNIPVVMDAQIKMLGTLFDPGSQNLIRVCKKGSSIINY